MVAESMNGDGYGRVLNHTIFHSSGQLLSMSNPQFLQNPICPLLALRTRTQINVNPPPQPPQKKGKHILLMPNTLSCYIHSDRESVVASPIIPRVQLHSGMTVPESP